MWGLAGMFAGMLVAGTCQRDARRWLAITVIAGAATLAIAWPTSAVVALRHDVRLAEADGIDVRQRYLEWQALVNLLAERPIVATGIGCLNDHRSEYYLRLPKRNTIAAFDQNGWLATAAETGLLGLAGLCWLFATHVTACWQRRREVVGCAVLAGLTGAAVASIGCSVQYAGLWPGFVLLLALADRAAAFVAEEA
jgi:O-antigen ligase